MIYIHDAALISPQQSFGDIDLEQLATSANNKMLVKEPAYPDIPLNILRRMGKAVRIGVGSALPLLKKESVNPDGIVIGTAMGGMEDCIRFLNQIIEYDEGQLTPTNFVQSTSNAIAGQIGLLTRNTAYNITHVHRGQAFENSLIDVMMLLRENPQAEYLVGGLDEISTYNYNIDFLAGCWKEEDCNNNELYECQTPGTIAGEGSAMFRINSNPEHAQAVISDIIVFQAREPQQVQKRIRQFMEKNALLATPPDLLFSGENGDIRNLEYYTAIESLIPQRTGIARFKHMTGEYATATAAAVWISVQLMKSGLPQHMIKRPAQHPRPRQVMIYNNFRGLQHSAILVNA